jgi:hypothetical protein
MDTSITMKVKDLLTLFDALATIKPIILAGMGAVRGAAFAAALTAFRTQAITNAAAASLKAYELARYARMEGVANPGADETPYETTVTLPVEDMLLIFDGIVSAKHFLIAQLGKLNGAAIVDALITARTQAITNADPASIVEFELDRYTKSDAKEPVLS